MVFGWPVGGRWRAIVTLGSVYRPTRLVVDGGYYRYGTDSASRICGVITEQLELEIARGGERPVPRLRERFTATSCRATRRQPRPVVQRQRLRATMLPWTDRTGEETREAAVLRFIPCPGL